MPLTLEMNHKCREKNLQKNMHSPKENIEKEKLLSLSGLFSIQCNIDKLNLNECA